MAVSDVPKFALASYPCKLRNPTGTVSPQTILDGGVGKGAGNVRVQQRVHKNFLQICFVARLAFGLRSDKFIRLVNLLSHDLKRSHLTCDSRC